MLKGLIFDMDGTITMTEALHHRAFAEIFKDFGIEFTLEEEVRKFAGSGSRVVFTEIFKKHGKPTDSKVIEQCIARKKKLYEEIVRSSDIPVVKGAHEFIKKIHGAGLEKIIATGNSNLDAVRFILEKVGLAEFFPELVSISEVPRGKPFPDVFLEAGVRIGCQPDEALVLEDAVNGVKAARSAGMRVIALETTTPAEALRSAGATHVVKDYTFITNEMLYGG